MRSFEIAPSILSADFTRLADAIRDIREGGATVLHVDVMDGHFVPNITIGLPVVKSLRAATDMTIDTHLMITEPGRYAVEFVKAGADMVSVHVEADPHLHRTLMAIKGAGAQAGIAINPATSLNEIEEAIGFADYILIMSVNPGFGGQRFINPALQKVRRLRQMLDERRLNARIEIDGGIDLNNIAEVVAAGAEILVAGSAIFGAADPEEATRLMREATVEWV